MHLAHKIGSSNGQPRRGISRASHYVDLTVVSDRRLSKHKLRLERPVQKWSDHSGQGFKVDQKRIVAVGTWQFHKRNMFANSKQFRNQFATLTGRK